MRAVFGLGIMIRTLALSEKKDVGGLIISIADKQYKPGEHVGEDWELNQINIIGELIFVNKQAIDFFIEDLKTLKGKMEDSHE